MSELKARMSASDVVRAWQARTLAPQVRGRHIELEVSRARAIAYRDIAELLLRAAGAHGCSWVDSRGEHVTGRGLAGNLIALTADAMSFPLQYVRHHRAVRAAARAQPVGDGGSLQHCLYLRLDHNFDLVSGGSVAHTAGIINSFRALLNRVTVVSSDHLRLVQPDEHFHEVVPDYRVGSNVPGLPLLPYSRQVADHVMARCNKDPPDFIYARCSLGNYAALLLRRELRRPYVCEYNGSVTWIARNWDGRALRFERLFKRVEQANLQTADIVVAVSRPSRDELVSRGVDADKILVNPNGVDTELFTPARDGCPIREQLRIDSDECVIGFIGTFGPWHGCEVLARAFCRLLSGQSNVRHKLRLLLIGEGQRLPEVRRLVESGGAADRVQFAGVVEQARAPDYLAACDLLVSPHVRNPDGSAFFGSPTKLFEYMAMGKAIIASDLDQIGEVLIDEHTALLVPPGDPEALAGTLGRAVADGPLRARLGAAARATVLGRYTWKQHANRILDRLREVAA